MTDLSSLTNEQLQALYNQPAQPTLSPESPTRVTIRPEGAVDLSKLSDADLQAVYNKQNVSTLADIGKSAVSGVGSGIVGLAGMIPDISSTMHSAANKYLFDPLLNSTVGAPSQIDQQPPDVNDLFGSKNIQNQVEKVTGDFYKPQTVAGEFAHSAGALAPSLLGGPETIGAKLLSRVAAPAAVGETASQLTSGTALQPYAKIAGTVVGGIGAARALAPRAATAPTVDELGGAAKSAYQHPTVAALELHPSSTAYTAGKITDSLNKSGFRELNAPQTYGIVNELRAPIGNTAKVADVQSVRTALGKVAGNFANPVEQQAANKAIKGIDDYLANLKPFDVAAGDAKAAASILNDARGNYAAKMRSTRFDDAEYRAELNAASAHSGGNINNATRQALKSILINPAKRRGFSSEEIAQMEKVVKGTATGNSMRIVGKILATHGMHGAGVLAGSIAAAPGTGGLSLAVPVAGYAARKLGDLSTARQVRKLDSMIAMRSPLGAQMPPRVPSTNPLTVGLLDGLVEYRATKARR